MYKQYLTFENFLLLVRLGRSKSCKVQHNISNFCINLLHTRVDVIDFSIVKHIIGFQIVDFLISCYSCRPNREHHCCTLDKSTAGCLSTCHQDIVALYAGLYLAVLKI